jgi:hypothetical protein
VRRQGEAEDRVAGGWGEDTTKSTQEVHFYFILLF